MATNIKHITNKQHTEQLSLTSSGFDNLRGTSLEVSVGPEEGPIGKEEVDSWLQRRGVGEVDDRNSGMS
jgi:hypothetical protein